MTFLGFRDDRESNLMFMRPPNNVIFTAATALFDERLYLRCAKKSRVPPVTQIQEPEEPEIIIDTESVPDDDSGAPFVPPHDYIPPRDDESSHDDDEPPSPPKSLPPQPHDAPGGGPSGKGPQRCSERDRKGTRKEGNIYPPGTSTDTNRHKRLWRYSATSIPNSGQSSNTVQGDPGHAKLATEEGALWKYLLSKVIPNDELPDPMNV